MVGELRTKTRAPAAERACAAATVPTPPAETKPSAARGRGRLEAKPAATHTARGALLPEFGCTERGGTDPRHLQRCTLAAFKSNVLREAPVLLA